jgi:hypothetical protein
MLSAAEIEQLPEEVQAHIVALDSRISQAELEIEDLQEQLKLARFRKFARSSESAEQLLQAMLFEEPEIQSTPPDEPENRQFPHHGCLTYAKEAGAKALVR